jgi:hypothetical protein
VEGAEGADSARRAADPFLPPRTPARGGVKASLLAKIGRVGRLWTDVRFRGSTGPTGKNTAISMIGWYRAMSGQQ